MGAHMAMTGHVKLYHPILWNAFKEGMRVVTVIESADIDIIDVEQQPAPGAAGKLAQELPFRHLGIAELNVGRDILQHQSAAQIILNQLNAAHDVIERLACIGYRQQIVQALAMHAGPA